MYRKAVLAITLTLLLTSMLTLAFNIQVLEANPIPIPSIWMPEEYIDANISLVDGVVQAGVNGTYPFAPLGTYYQVMMYYPVPPDADRITVEMNDTELDWTYGNETYPTVLGNWPMIIWDIAPVPEYFEIETYYEHPIPMIDGNYTFLYAMGTGKYLNYYAKETIAYVSVNISKHVADRRSLIDVYTIGYNAMTEEWTWNPADYIITEEDETWIVTLTVISEMFHPLIEDLLITIKSKPKTWTVDDDGPADFSSIQEAINAANSGDTIFVHSGTYYENVIVNKTVSLVGENKLDTIVDGKNVGTVVTVIANNVNVTGVTVRNGWGEWQSGIALNFVENCNIFENIIADNELGIALGYTNNSRILDNYVTHNEGGIFLMVSNYNIFRGNEMVENTGDFAVLGENLSDFINDVDSSNTIDGKPIYYWVNKRDMTVPFDAGYVALVNCTLITIEWLIQTEAVQLIYTTSSTITNNIVGLSLYYSSNNIIFRNNFTHSGHGIYLSGSSNNIISENDITANSMFGILLWVSSNNSVTGNNIAGNGYDGIYLYSCSNNTVAGNNLANNRGGIRFLWASNNHIYHNNFMNNTYPVHTSSSVNTWDNGFEGNYWSDYEERYPDVQELDGSGIWDTPYVIDENNQDNYPLMNPWTPSECTVTIYSSPARVKFTIDGISRTAPWSGTYVEGTSVGLIMPETHDGYVWSHWLEDGDTNRTKTVTMGTNVTLTAVFTPDTSPPIISIVSPENKTYAVEDVPLTSTMSESTFWIGYSLDDQANITIAGNTTLTGLSDGMHSLVVYASDIAGNLGSSDMVYFTVDTTPPIADAGSNQAANVGTFVTFDASGSTDNVAIVSCKWNFGDGTTDTGITCNHTYTEPGNYTVTLTVKDAAGNLVTDTIIVTVIEEAQAPFPWWILGPLAAVIVGIIAVTILWRRRK